MPARSFPQLREPACDDTSISPAAVVATIALAGPVLVGACWMGTQAVNGAIWVGAVFAAALGLLPA